VIDEATILKAVRLLLAASPGSQVIVFGSHARGQAGEASDLDLLVIEPEIKARRQEMVRLSDVLRPLSIPVDIVVISRKTFDEWAGTPGTIIYEAARQGRVYDQVA